MKLIKNIGLTAAAIGIAAISTGASAKPFGTFSSETIDTAGSSQYDGRYVYSCANEKITPQIGFFAINGLDVVSLPFLGEAIQGVCVPRERITANTPYFNTGKIGDYDAATDDEYPQYLAGGLVPADGVIEEVYNHVEAMCTQGLTLLPGLIFTGVGENLDVENDPNNCAGLASLATREFIRTFREVVPAPMMSANLDYKQTVDHHTAFWGAMKWDVYHRYSKIPTMNYETYNYGAANPSTFASVLYVW